MKLRSLSGSCACNTSAGLSKVWPARSNSTVPPCSICWKTDRNVLFDPSFPSGSCIYMCTRLIRITPIDNSRKIIEYDDGIWWWWWWYNDVAVEVVISCSNEWHLNLQVIRGSKMKVESWLKPTPVFRSTVFSSSQELTFTWFCSWRITWSSNTAGDKSSANSKTQALWLLSLGHYGTKAEGVLSPSGRVSNIWQVEDKLIFKSSAGQKKNKI